MGAGNGGRDQTNKRPHAPSHHAHNASPPRFPPDTVRTHFSQFGDLLDVVSGGGEGRGDVLDPHYHHSKKTPSYPFFPSRPSTLPPPQSIMRDRLTRQPRGFGFVTFADPVHADAACAAPHWLDGNRVRSSRENVFFESIDDEEREGGGWRPPPTRCATADAAWVSFSCHCYWLAFASFCTLFGPNFTWLPSPLSPPPPLSSS